jgi:hypothetical protein
MEHEGTNEDGEEGEEGGKFGGKLGEEKGVLGAGKGRRIVSSTGWTLEELFRNLGVPPAELRAEVIRVKVREGGR